MKRLSLERGSYILLIDGVVILLILCEFSYKDFLTLFHRQRNILDKSGKGKFNKAIFVFPTNEAMNNKTEKCLRKLDKPVLNIRAIDNPSCKNNIR